MAKAIDIFNESDRGILNIIRAADIYALHILAKIRNQEVDKDFIDILITKKGISGLNLLGTEYKDNELELLKKDGHLKQIGQQILFATYTALEIYLIEKFREYYKHFSKNIDEAFVQASLKRFYFRGLDDIKNNYRDCFKIHLDCFEIPYHSDEKSNFELKAKNSWETINFIAKARNDIAHKGKSEEYQIVTLMDSWYPFEFVRNWVSFFDSNFDYLVYENRETRLIEEYKKRLLDKQKKHNSKKRA